MTEIATAMQPYGQALLDFHNGCLDGPLIVRRDDGDEQELPPELFFRGENNLQPGEALALNRCRGRVLDVGAGAGAISLALQIRGFEVHALDVSPEACRVMEVRGVARVTCADIADFHAEPFDTVLILGRTIGMVGDLNGMRAFLKDLHRLVQPDGRVIFNSLDVRKTDIPMHLAYQEDNERAGRYRGEFRIRFEYLGVQTAYVSWLHIDAATLRAIAAKEAWRLELLEEYSDGGYLAELRPLA